MDVNFQFYRFVEETGFRRFNSQTFYLEKLSVFSQNSLEADSLEISQVASTRLMVFGNLFGNGPDSFHMHEELADKMRERKVDRIVVREFDGQEKIVEIKDHNKQIYALNDEQYAVFVDEVIEAMTKLKSDVKTEGKEETPAVALAKAPKFKENVSLGRKTLGMIFKSSVQKRSKLVKVSDKLINQAESYRKHCEARIERFIARDIEVRARKARDACSG